jgi:ribosomal protein L7/L12
MVTKTAWQHVLGENVVVVPGDRPMKTDLDARFEGTFSEFVDWMQATFKNPADLPIRVHVGGPRTVGDLPPKKSETERATEAENTVEGKALSVLSGGRVSRRDSEKVIEAIYRLMRAIPQGKERETQLIKVLRDMVPLGLSEAKTFISSLPATGATAESPF